MGFTKTTFVNGSTPPINNVNLNNISDGLEFLSNNIGTTSNSGNNYSLTLTNSKYNYDVGIPLTFTSNATNTGGSTLNVNSLGAKTIKKEIEGSLIDIFYGDIAINRSYIVIYDGTYFVLLNPSRRDEYYQASSNNNDSYAISLSNEMIYNFGVYSGLTVRMKADVSNSGSATLSVNSGTAKTIKKVTRSGVVDLTDGDIQAGGLYTLIYDGTYFQLQNPTQQFGITGSFTGDNTNDRFINLGFTPKMVILWIDRGTYKVMTITINNALYGLKLDTTSGGIISTLYNNSNGASITTNGFTITYGGEFNNSGTTTYYSAF